MAEDIKTNADDEMIDEVDEIDDSSEKSSKSGKKDSGGKKSSDKEKKEKVKLGERIKRFFRDYKSELKKVVWPTREQLVKNTGVVLFAVIFMAAIIGVLDLLFGFGISMLTNVKGLFS